MILPFKNLPELLDKLPDENSCRNYLEQIRWNGNPRCPHCGHDHAYKLQNTKRYRCSNRTCRTNFSVTIGTIFEGSNIPLRKWFVAIYLNTAHKKGISALQLAKDISVARRTAWFMLHRIREMVRPKEELTFKNHVMMDETFHGGKEKNKSNFKRMQLITGERVPEKTPVFGMIEKDGKATLRVVPDIKSETLKPIINKIVDKDSIVVTDSAPMYNGLQNDYKDHFIVNHSNSQYVNQGYTTNHIESFFAIFKRTVLGTYHSISSKHLQRYCTECEYRFNTRKIKDAERFTITLQNADGRLKYNDLIGKTAKLAS